MINCSGGVSLTLSDRLTVEFTENAEGVGFRGLGFRVFTNT